MSADDPAPHEFGHLLGLKDRYKGVFESFFSGDGPEPGWAGNIMGEPAGAGAVDQRNIDPILNRALKDYKGEAKYETKIDLAIPRD